MTSPYVWGGDDPLRGFDCSGLIVEVLQGVGLIRRGTDMCADDLLKYLRNQGIRTTLNPRPGTLVFWLNKAGTRAVHVEMVIDSEHTIGASGGGEGCKTLEDAIRLNAFVKLNHIDYRGENYVMVDPFPG